MHAKRSKDAHGLRGKHWEKGTMIVLARIVLPSLALNSLTLSGVLLATIGTLFKEGDTYEQPGTAIRTTRRRTTA